MLKIDDNIPIPPSYKTKRAAERELFNSLQVGQSIFFPTPRPDCVRGLLNKWKLVEHFEITTRQVIEGEILGLRVWRLD